MDENVVAELVAWARLHVRHEGCTCWPECRIESLGLGVHEIRVFHEDRCHIVLARVREYN